MQRSVEERTRGNQLYQQAAKDGIPSWTKQQYLQECLPFYRRAFEFANNKDDKASAKKNLGHAYRQMAGTFEHTRSEVGRLNHFMLQAIESFNSATLLGSSCKTEQWMSDVFRYIEVCVEVLETTVPLEITHCEQREKLILLRKVANTIPDSISKATWCLKLGEAIFNAGVVAYESQLYDECKRHLEDCNEPLEEAIRYGKSDTRIVEEAKDYQERVYIHLCISRSVSLRMQTEKLFHTHLLNQESINFELIWDVVDMFKQCTLLVREQDTEQEAITLSRLGKIFDVVLKLPEKAKGYYKQSFQLAKAMHPRTFDTKDWYKDCSQAVARYQKETVQREEDAWQKEKAPYLEKLKPELEGLSKAFKEGYVALLKYVYSKHPPKNSKHVLIDDGKTKKAVKFAILHYHPDKLNKKEDTKWYVLCEEITKMLSQKYEELKAME